MKIGMTLPSMVPDSEYSRDTTLDWCKVIDEGPFESISVGERTTYPNQEITVLLSAAAAITERVKLYSTIFILPTHATAVLAKQAATIDVLSNGRLTVGIGSGQPSRLDSCEIAVNKMKKFNHNKENLVAASDAFFPFVDGIESLIQSGVKAIIQPHGSIRDKEIIRFANNTNTVLVFSKTRHFRH